MFKQTVKLPSQSELKLLHTPKSQTPKSTRWTEGLKARKCHDTRPIERVKLSRKLTVPAQKEDSV